jgi:hypothetical protein
MWRLLSRVRYSVTEESRLQSILAISVVSTKVHRCDHNLVSITMKQQYGSFIETRNFRLRGSYPLWPAFPDRSTS